MEQQTGKKDSMLAVSILIAAFVIGGSLIYSAGVKSGGGSLARTDTAVRPTPADNNLTADDDVILGDPNAPITLVAFGDFQCPYCKKMFDEAESQIRDEYIATGKVKMVFRDFPLESIHPYARAAAEAAECARDQGKYWLYHDELFNRQQGIPSMDFNALATEIGLDEKSFAKCVADKKYESEVTADYNDGIAAGVTGTPATFIIGKDGKVLQFIEGAQPYAMFKQVLDAALAK